MWMKIFKLLIVLSGFYLATCAADTIVSLSGKSELKVDLYMPEGTGPFAAILVLHTSGGVRGPDLDYAKRLMQLGYAALVPYYFAAHNISSPTRASALTVHAEAILDDLAGSVEYLKKNPKIDKSRLGAVGFSMGGYWAMVLAAKGYVQAGVSNYGVLSGVRNEREQKYQFAEIFNERSAPVLIMHGEKDGTQTVRGARRLSELLQQRKLAYEMQLYPDADHDYDRGPKYDSVEAKDSWNRAQAFFGKYLSQPEPAKP